MFHKQLRSDLSERVESCDASDKSRSVGLLEVHDGIHKSVCDLLARADERGGNLFLAFRLIGFAFFRLKHLKEENVKLRRCVEV